MILCLSTLYPSGALVFLDYTRQHSRPLLPNVAMNINNFMKGLCSFTSHSMDLEVNIEILRGV